jgi:hypothetical protein
VVREGESRDEGGVGSEGEFNGSLGVGQELVKVGGGQAVGESWAFEELFKVIEWAMPMELIGRRLIEVSADLGFKVVIVGLEPGAVLMVAGF